MDISKQIEEIKAGIDARNKSILETNSQLMKLANEKNDLIQKKKTLDTLKDQLRLATEKEAGIKEQLSKNEAELEKLKSEIDTFESNGFTITSSSNIPLVATNSTNKPSSFQRQK